MKTKKGLALFLLVMFSVMSLMIQTTMAVTVVNGKFKVLIMDTSAPRTINTGLLNIRVLRIYIYDPPRPAGVVYTNDQLQSDHPGCFLYQEKWLTGLNIVSGTFTLNHAMFKTPGVTYYWEAIGD